MDRQMYFSETPTVTEWGAKRNVPLNIKEETTIENGQEVKGYRADVVPKVTEPITVDSIVDAAIASEYKETQLKRIMRNIADSSNAEVTAYTAFVAEVTAAAKAAGYE